LRASSSILSWNKQAGVQPLLEDIEWFVRPVKMPGEGLILAGQRANRNPGLGYVGINISRMKVYSGFSGIREEYVLPLPAKLRLFDFEWADIDGDGSMETLAIDRRQKLLVYDSQNSLIWVSSEDYGGSRNFIGPSPSTVDLMQKQNISEEAEADRETSYVPTRILVADINDDGRQDVIVGKNKLVSTKWLSNTREYNGGSVSCLTWRDSGLRELWRTNNISGYIADYSFVVAGQEGDEGGEGGMASEKAERLMQLHVAQVPSRAFFGFMFESESKVLRYDLNVR
jgi:hypothetical protein